MALIETPEKMSLPGCKLPSYWRVGGRWLGRKAGFLFPGKTGLAYRREPWELACSVHHCGKTAGSNCQWHRSAHKSVPPEFSPNTSTHPVICPSQHCDICVPKPLDTHPTSRRLPPLLILMNRSSRLFLTCLESALLHVSSPTCFWFYCNVAALEVWFPSVWPLSPISLALWNAFQHSAYCTSPW